MTDETDAYWAREDAHWTEMLVKEYGPSWQTYHSVEYCEDREGSQPWLCCMCNKRWSTVQDLHWHIHHPRHINKLITYKQDATQSGGSAASAQPPLSPPPPPGLPPGNMEVDHAKGPKLTPNLVTQVLESSDRLQLLEQLLTSLPKDELDQLIERCGCCYDECVHQ